MKIQDSTSTQPASREEALIVAAKDPARNNGASAGPSGASRHPTIIQALVRFFSSLRLTVVLLALGIVLVFAGTLAQVNLGLYKAQNEFFRGFLIFWGPKGAGWKIPVFPGGYLVGGLLLINLLAAHITRFKFTRKKAGIWLTHVGIILLLVGQLLTDVLARETSLHLREGQAKNYSEAPREDELAVIDVSNPRLETVVAIPQARLSNGKTIAHREMPFKIHVKQFFANSRVWKRSDSDAPAAADMQGAGQQIGVKGVPKVTKTDERDVPSAIIQIQAPGGASLGTWLVSEFLESKQAFSYQGHTYEISMRPRRFYKPFSMKLLKFHHDVYAGTDTPKNFSSRVVLDRPDSGEHREVLIYMNHPLRYSGETFYQADFDRDDHGTVLQVVHNPGWLTPYFACIIVALGLAVQFMSHLLGFARKRKSA